MFYQSALIERKAQEALLQVGGDRLNKDALHYAGKVCFDTLLT